MQEFKKPNLKAPRFRPKRDKLVSKELFEKFQLKYPQHKIDYQTFALIIKDHTKKICQEVIDNRDGVELPEGLGFIFIGSITIGAKKEVIDYGKSIKYNSRVRVRNWESDGKLAKIYYTNFSAKYSFQDKQLWMFKSARSFSRDVSKAYKEQSNMYIEVANMVRISKLFSKRVVKNMFQDRTAKQIKNYEDFDV